MVSIYYFIVCGPGILDKLCWMLLGSFRVFHEVAIKMLAEAANISRLVWGWRIHFQSDSFLRLASWCWMWAEGLSSSPLGLLHRACVSSRHGNRLPSGQLMHERAVWKLQCFLWQPQQPHSIISTISYWLDKSGLFIWGRITQVCEYHETRIIRRLATRILQSLIHKIITLSHLWKGDGGGVHVQGGEISFSPEITIFSFWLILLVCSLLIQIFSFLHFFSLLASANVPVSKMLSLLFLFPF